MQNFPPKKVVTFPAILFRSKQPRQAVCWVTTGDSSVTQQYTAVQRVRLFCCSGAFDIDFNDALSTGVVRLIIGSHKLQSILVVSYQHVGQLLGKLK